MLLLTTAMQSCCLTTRISQAYSEAIEAIRLKPNYATAYYHLGLIEAARNNKVNALKAYLLSLRYESNSNYAQETQSLINKLDLDSNRISFQDLKEFQAKLTAIEPNESTSLTAGASILQPKKPTLLSEIGKAVTPSTNAVNKNNQASITTIESFIASKQWSQAHKAIGKLLETHTK